MKSIEAYFIKFSSVLYCLLPVLIITGPFLPDFSLSIISIIFLILTVKNRNFNIYNNLYFKIFILFYFYIVLVSIFSDNLKLSLETSIFYIRFGIFALAICYILENNNSIIGSIKIIFVSLYLILFFDTIYQLIVGKNIIGLTYINLDNFRLTSFFGKNEVLGSYIARFYTFVLSIIFLDAYKNKKKINKFLIFFITIISICTVIMSGERTALFLIVISCLLLALSIISLRKYFAFLILNQFIFVTNASTQALPTIPDGSTNTQITQTASGIDQINIEKFYLKKFKSIIEFTLKLFKLNFKLQKLHK